MEIRFLQDADTLQGALRHGLGGDPSVRFQQFLLHRAGVDPDPDGDAMGFAGVGDQPDLVRTADVAGVDPDLVDPGVKRREGQFVVHLDVRDKRDLHRLFQRPDGVDITEICHREPHHLTSGGGEFPRLGHVGLDVPLGCVEHGLDDDGGVAADGEVSDGDRSCGSSIHEDPPLK